MKHTVTIDAKDMGKSLKENMGKPAELHISTIDTDPEPGFVYITLPSGVSYRVSGTDLLKALRKVEPQPKFDPASLYVPRADVRDMSMGRDQ